MPQKNDIIVLKAMKQDMLCVFRGKRKGRLVEALTFGALKYRLPAVRRKWRTACARYSAKMS
jgi:hypothetical protein